MALSRQEYPALLTSIQPHQAVAVLNERVKLIGKINSDIADWLSERRRVEEAYVQGLKKLAGRRPQDVSSELGVFQTPWQSIVNSMGSLAQSHSNLAQRIETDVEKPLREYQTKNREMQAMSTVQGNLAALAKDVENAQKKADRVKEKGGKSNSVRIENASSDVENAKQQWDVQAPYIFEQLQALDETRSNHLRDVLTQFQTHEVDQVEQNRVIAERCLNDLLNVDTGTEISLFVANTTGQRQSLPSRQPTDSPQSTNRMPPTLARGFQDSNSQRVENSADNPVSGLSPERRHGGLSGFKRLGTIIGRRQSTKPTELSSTTEKKSRSTLNPLRRGPSSRDMQVIPSPATSSTNLASSPSQPENIPRQSHSHQPMETPTSRTVDRRPDRRTNGDNEGLVPQPTRSSSLPFANGNGASSGIAELQENPRPSAQPEPQPQPQVTEIQRDAEGFSVPPSNIDDISRAQQEAEAIAGDNEAPQFKLDIRKEPIQEDGDVQTALSNVASTLRLQAQQTAPPRRPGATRGRRDVRNTMFVPNPPTPEPLAATESPAIPESPFGIGRTAILPKENYRGSDSQSIQSGHSASNLANTGIQHPEMHQVGLNASVVETVSAWFSSSQVTKAVVIGELALAYNFGENAASSDSQNVRLENFPVLEKVAPNPSFIRQIPSTSGEYNVSLPHIRGTAVAFKYQVHLDEAHLAAHAPVILTPSWKIEPNQASVILSYALNPPFTSALKRSVTLRNVTVIIGIEGTKASACQSKPAGTFSRDKSLIYWKLGDLTLDGSSETPHKVLARFATESKAEPGNVEARWEISGDDAIGLGSGLSLSQFSNRREEGSDLFADESATNTSGGIWQEVPVVRKLVSGKYLAQ